MNMVRYPTLEDCEKIAEVAGNNPEGPFGPLLVDWIVWNSVDGTIDRLITMPDNWFVFHSPNDHTVAKSGMDTMTGQEILSACKRYVKYYLEND